jgi:hypothetical protein
MKHIAILIMLAALFLLYRIAFPKQADAKKDSKIPSPPPDTYEAVVKSRFVLPDRSSSAQYDDRTEDSDKQDKKSDIFTAGNANPLSAVIPTSELNEVFGEDVNPGDLVIVRDENEEDGNEDLSGRR